MNMCFTKEPTVAEVEVRPAEGVVKVFISKIFSFFLKKNFYF